MAIRALAIAGECITSRREQDEILRIFDKIHQETGWRIAFVIKELKKTWGWLDDEATSAAAAAAMQPHVSPQQHLAHQLAPLALHASPMQAFPQVTLQQVQSLAATSMPTMRPRNPLLADFALGQHPYQSWYVAPSSVAPHSHFSY